MRRGSDRDALRNLADRLRDEFTDPAAAGRPGTGPPSRAERSVGASLDAEDEALVARLREALAGIAATPGHGTEHPLARVTETALDGAEFEIRRALAEDEAERVLDLMPSFVFLVALSVADRDRAMELSERTSKLIEEPGR